jgi:ASC-1-like (ASCH) protein
MDPDKIFGLFGDYDKNESGRILEDIRESVSFRLGLFTKIIFNHINFSNKVVEFFKRANTEFDTDDIKNAGEFVVYNKAWLYVKNIDVKDSKTFEELKTIQSLELITALRLSIHFFEEIEEYEKCAHLKKLQDVLEFFQS